VKKFKLDAFFVIIVTVLLFFSVRLIADVLDPMPEGDFWGELVKFVSSIKGQTTMGIVALLVQLAMHFFRTSMADFAGVWKWVIVSGLSLIGVVLGGLASGSDIMAAVTSGAALAAFQVWIHQFLKALTEPKKMAKSVI